MAKVKVGDKVIIVDASKIMGGWSSCNNGVIMKVLRVFDDGDMLLSRNGGSVGFLVTSEEYDAVRKVSKFKPEKMRKGEEVLIVDTEGIDMGEDFWKNGDIVRFLSVDSQNDAFLETSQNGADFFITDYEFKHVRRLRKIKGVKQ